MSASISKAWRTVRMSTGKLLTRDCWSNVVLPASANDSLSIVFIMAKLTLDHVRVTCPNKLRTRALRAATIDGRFVSKNFLLKKRPGRMLVSKEKRRQQSTYLYQTNAMVLSQIPLNERPEPSKLTHSTRSHP